MHTTDLSTKDIINTMANEWKTFREVNERKTNEEKQKGSADPLTVGYLQNLNTSLDKQSEMLQRLATIINRPSVGRVVSNLPDEDPRYTKAFCDYLRHGHEQELNMLQTKSILGTDKEAGYTATRRLLQQVNNELTANSPLRRMARVTQIATDVLELLEDGADSLAGWTQDLNTVLKDTKVSQLYKKVIPVHELYAQPKATQRFLEDPIIDIEAWLANKVSDAFTRKESAAFISGDGVGKPRGILNYDKDKVKEVETTESARINADSMLNLFFALPEIYATGAKFLMSRDVVQAIRMLKNASTGQYLWQPSMTVGNPDTILGMEVVTCADMPSLAADNKVVVYGDFQHAYQIVYKGGVRVLRDPYTEKPYTKFYTTQYVGGDLVDCNALRVLVAK